MPIGNRKSSSLCFLLFSLVFRMYAQSERTATLVGNVTDSSGAVVVGAKVTVVNVNTSFASETTTSTEGYYSVPYLASGSYRLTVEASGFKKYVQEGITVRSAESPRVDVQLEVGAMTESVSVTAAPPLLETETSVSGGTIDGDTLNRMPISQKRAVRMLYWYPGAQASVAGIHVLGQRQRAMGYVVDGVNAKEPGIGGLGETSEQLSTTQDAFQEVKVYTTGTPAEIGHAAGGMMSIVFRSGANQFHGSAEERYINNKMIHRAYLEQNPRTTPFLYQEITGLASGPLVIPKLYDGHNKTFWLAGWEQHYEDYTSLPRTSVPTPEMLRGDFSIPGAPGGPFPIYNPFTTRQEGTTWIRDPFPSNQIPQSLFDPAVKNFLGRNVFAAPNQLGTPTRSGYNENLVASQLKPVRRTRWDAKIDHQFSPAHKIFGRYSHAHHRAQKGDRDIRILWDEIMPNLQPQPIDQINIVFSDMYIFGPTASNEFRAGFNRRHQSEFPFTFNGDWGTQLGIPNVDPTTFPNLNAGFGLGGLPASRRLGEDFTFQDNFSLIRGKHTLKFGYELIRTRFNAYSSGLPGGTYNFGGTDQPFTPNTGIGFASFLLGAVSSATFTTNYGTWLPRWWSHQTYIQDDWKPVRNLTFNLGLRWSYETPFRTKHDRHSTFDPDATDPLTGLRGSITHPRAALARSDWNNLAPRVGLAWTFHPKMVFRGSYGIVHQDIFSTGASDFFQEYAASATVQAAPGDPRHSFLLSQGPPRIQYNVTANGSVPFVGTNFSSRNAEWYDRNLRMPYVMSWSGGIQYQMSGTWLLEALYQGQAGVGLIGSWNINAIPLDISRDPAVLNQIANATQNYRPYTNFGTIDLQSNFGHNTHHAGTLRFEKRYGSGLTLNAFYVFARTITDADGDGGGGGMTYYNRRLEKARAGYDIQHKLVTTLNYELPFGKDRKFLNRGGFTNAVIGGWDLSWLHTLQEGQPFSVTFGGSPNRYLPGASRPNMLTTVEEALVPDWNIGHRFPVAAQSQYLKESSFAYPAAFTVGTLGRNTFESPGINWVMFSLAKWFKAGERMRFQLRVDGANLPFKQPQFSSPNGTYNTANNTFARVGTGTRGAYNTVGTSQSNWMVVGRFEF